MEPGSEFAGRVVAISGAGRGRGAGYASFFAERGASVVVNDLGTDVWGEGSSPEPAESVADAIVADGGVAVPNHDDVATDEGARNVVARALTEFGRLDVVVNNAGNVGFGAIDELEPDEWDRMLSIHAGGAYHLSRAAWPSLVAQRYGRVVMCLSSAIFGSPYMANYAAAKGAMTGLMRGLNLEGAPRGVMVNAVIPGAWRTRMDDAMYDYLRRTGKPFLASEEEIRENPGRDLRDPANATPPNPDAERHVSAVVGWLASEECDFGGVILHAGLGRVARVFFAQGRGYSAPDITLDGLVAHREEVLTEADYEVPRSSSDSLASFRG